MPSAVYGRPIYGRPAYGHSSDASSSTSVTVTVSALSGAGTLPSAGLSLGATASASSLVGSGVLPSATVQLGVTASASAISSSGSLGTADCSTGSTASASVLSCSGTLPDVAIEAEAILDASAFSADGTLPEVSVQLGGSVSVTAAALAGSGTLTSPAFVLDWTQAVSAFSGSGTLASATATGGDSESVDAEFDVSSLVGLAGFGFPDAGDLDPSRDYDILEHIQTLLLATTEFDGVYLRGLNEIGGVGADDVRLALIEPGTEADEDLWDDESEPGGVVNGTCFVTICVRDEDQRTRDREADRLKMIARNAVNRRSLAGITFPDFTRFRSWQSMPAKPPERRIRGTFNYRHLIEGFESFATNE